MYIYLSKILPLLLLPIGIIFGLLIIALLLLWRRKRKTSAVFIILAMTLLWVSSMPIVADTFLGRMEQQFPAVSLSDIPASGCVVVLGGAVKPVLPPRVDIELSDSVDRIFKTASLYKAGKVQLIIVAGGNQPWSAFGQSEAEATSTLLVAMGVPDSAIMLDETSRNTRENAINAKTLLGEIDCERPLLVTSAAHMKRSVASFEKIGIDVFPVSSDVRVARTTTFKILDFLPHADALNMTTAAMREWIGQKVYQFRGWN